MSNDVRFDNRVAIVTGAGNGLGRSHALLLASRGAKVVVNDLGGAATGGGKSSAAAEKVVAEIKAAGGEAVANFDSVEDGKKIVQCALDHFKRIDVVINNAGILRDSSFHKMTEEDWELIQRVHVLGAFRVTHAAWPHLREQGYGRVLFTASAAGIYGNFGQANYSTAKLGLVGLAQTLAIEGHKANIHVNAIAPIAGSRLTATVLPPEMIEALKPEYVSPLAAWLCSESCEESGGLFEVGGGFFGKLRWERSEGKMFRPGRPIAIEAVRDSWSAITGFEKTIHPRTATESLAPIISNAQAGPSKGGNEFINVDEALGFEFPPVTSSYDERDIAIYALGVGAAADPSDSKDLRLVYEMHSDGFQALPTFGVTPALNAILAAAKEGQTAPGLHYGFERILHGEQYLELKRPLPSHAKLTHKIRIKDIFDKGKNAVVITEAKSFDENGDELIVNELTSVVRGAGGWGGDRGPSSDVNVPPDRAPDAVITEKISANQGLLYRLSGDWNPLHVDPAFASAFGFEKPILHGLCTFGYAARHVMKSFAGNDMRLFKSIKVRFADSVYPGETVVTEMWKENDRRILFRCKVKERDKVVISNAAIELYKEIPVAKAPGAAKTAAATTASAPAATPASANAEPTTADIFSAIGQHVQKNAGIVASIGTVYLFKLSSPNSEWTVDLKNGAGSVTSGAVGKADCTLELSDADFMGMCTGKLDAQKLYFGGKLKISGNVMASQKLEFLKKIDPATVVAAAKARGAGGAVSAPAATAPATTTVSASGGGEEVFAKLKERLAKNSGLAKEVGALLRFRVGTVESAKEWTVDLRTSPGSIAEGAPAKADATFTLTGDDLRALAQGESAQALFQKGRLRVDGDVRVAHRLGFLKGAV
ncbi:MAG TPA: SDR family NAD(P)-dependent oxidoreductase [bacterium]|nr:SDR family NAD(P)-dependent oxidoreductase [bacterium]